MASEKAQNFIIPGYHGSTPVARNEAQASPCKGGGKVFPWKAPRVGHVAVWGYAYQLLVNRDKTKLILFRVQQLLTQLPEVMVPFLGRELTSVPHVKDLGIIL